jgi:hypothetical protein
VVVDAEPPDTPLTPIFQVADSQESATFSYPLVVGVGNANPVGNSVEAGIVGHRAHRGDLTLLGRFRQQFSEIDVPTGWQASWFASIQAIRID